MDLVELWVSLKTRYDKHPYNSRRLTQLHQKFPHIASNVNEAKVTTGI